MGPVKVIKVLPLLYLFVQVNIVRIIQQLIKLFFICKVGSLNFSIELWPSRLYVTVFYAKVFYMPVELGLELVAIVGLDRMDAEWELIDHVVNKINGA